MGKEPSVYYSAPPHWLLLQKMQRDTSAVAEVG